jgi:hypothetical protein
METTINMRDTAVRVNAAAEGAEIEISTGRTIVSDADMQSILKANGEYPMTIARLNILLKLATRHSRTMHGQERMAP